MQYESFCSQYQEEAGWSKKSQAHIGDGTKRIPKQITIKTDKKDLAKELWKRLKPKTNWYINFKNLDKFYENVITELKEEGGGSQQKVISITKINIFWFTPSVC
jgi:protoheme ferro-lyase